MKTRTISTILIGLILQTTYSYAQLFCGQPPEYNTEKAKGGYKKCKIFSYTYLPNGTLDDASEKLEGVYTFDKSGNRIKDIRYSSDGSIIVTCSYKYDCRNNKTEWKMFNKHRMWRKNYKYKRNSNKIIKINFTSDDLTENSEEIFTYDNKGNLIQKDLIKADESYFYINKIKFQNDSLGRMIELISIGSDGVVQVKHLYRYDEKGNVVEKVEYEPVIDTSFELKKQPNIYIGEVNNTIDAGILTRYRKVATNFYLIDEKGIKIEDIHNHFPDSTSMRELYKTNNKGQIAEINNFINGNIYSKKFYLYDDYGNKIEDVFYDTSNIPMNKTIYMYSI